MVEDDHGSCRTLICGAAPGIFNPGTLLINITTSSSNSRKRRRRMHCCFAHVADVINNTVSAAAAAPKASTNQLVETETKLNIPSPPCSDFLDVDMDRSMKKESGSVEFRGKDYRRIKLELKTKQSLSSFESDIRICEGDGAGVADTLHASFQLENSRKNSSSLRRVGSDRFGLWSESGGRPTKVCFKWLPIQPVTSVSKLMKHGDGEFALKNVNESKSAKEARPVAKPARPQASVEPGKNYNEELKNFLCGGFAGVVSRTAVAPLDLIKTHLITSHGMHGYHKTAREIFYEIWNADGWRGLFRGNGVNCIRVAPCKAIELCVFEIVKKVMSRKGNPFRGVAAPVAGGAAGMAGTLATYPLELIRTRISLQPQKYAGAVSAILKVIEEEGFLALYSGLTPSLLGVFPYAATNYFVYDGLRSAYHRATGTKRVPTGLTLLFGAVAAAASSAVTYPLEVARRQLQLGSAAVVARHGTLEVLQQIYAEEGFLALYRGLGTTWLKLVPAAGISFVCYEAARRAWELEEQRAIQRRLKRK